MKKLVTLDIAKTGPFRERINALLSSEASKWSLKSTNPNSVDGEDRVSDVKFRSVPHIDEITSAGERESQIQGTIDMDVTLETQVHNVEGENTVSDVRTFTGKFRIDVVGAPRKSSDLSEEKIKSLTMKLRDFTI